MTYDREVSKMPVEAVVEMHKRLMRPAGSANTPQGEVE